MIVRSEQRLGSTMSLSSSRRMKNYEYDRQRRNGTVNMEEDGDSTRNQNDRSKEKANDIYR